MMLIPLFLCFFVICFYQIHYKLNLCKAYFRITHKIFYTVVISITCMQYLSELISFISLELNMLCSDAFATIALYVAI